MADRLLYKFFNQNTSEQKSKRVKLNDEQLETRVENVEDKVFGWSARQISGSRNGEEVLAQYSYMVCNCTLRLVCSHRNMNSH